MFTDLSTTGYPKTLLIRNTPNGMIWQIYHVDNKHQAIYLSTNAKSNAFEGIILENYQPSYEETSPEWREEMANSFIQMLPNHLTKKESVYDDEERYDRAHNPAESWDGDNSPSE